MIFSGIVICCPACKGELETCGPDGADSEHQTELACSSCLQRYPILFGIPDLRLFSDPYIDIESDRAKGLKLAEKFDELSFEGFVEYYYSITSVVPPKHVKQYSRGLIAGPARSQAALLNWQALSGKPIEQNSAVLEIGCGTAPFLLQAARFTHNLVGIDIAFRWLVVARKRLAQAGLNIPLICACAEALPFPAGSFDLVVAESTLEHLKDLSQALAELLRVMRPAASLWLSTPNRFSLGPDPQIGVFAGGYLPEAWVSAIAARQGAIPPKRHLLSAYALRSLLETSGLSDLRFGLPDIPPEQRAHFGRGLRVMIDLYSLARRLPVSRQLLFLIGPTILATATYAPLS